MMNHDMILILSGRKDMVRLGYFTTL